MKQLPFLILLIILASQAKATVIINEIMYNPDGSDRNREWIEIYSNSTVNFSGWRLVENKVNHLITLINGSWSFKGYAIIADDPDTFRGDYPSYNRTLFESSFSLKNSGEIIALKNGSSHIIDRVNYSSAWGGKETSLEKIAPFAVNNITYWLSSFTPNGTPGEENSVFGTCDWTIGLLIDREIWEMTNASSRVSWKVKVAGEHEGDSATFAYWIEDPLGTIVKTKIEKTTNSSQIFGSFRKTFRDPGGYLLKASIVNSTCQDREEGNDIATKSIAVVGEGTELNAQQNSLLQIEEISPDSVTFGKIINVKAIIYRGDTQKYAVSLYVKDKKGRKISEKSSLQVRNKFTTHHVRVPVLLKENCNRETDEYIVVMEGLGTEDSSEILVKKQDCATKNPEAKNKAQTPYELKEYPPTITAGAMARVVLVVNNDQRQRTYKAWSYIYRGKKCYSCHNNSFSNDYSSQSFLLNPDEQKILTFYLPVDQDLKEGEYNLKIKINKDNQKTNKEITKPLYVQENISVETTSSQITTLGNPVSLRRSGAPTTAFSQEPMQKRELNKQIKGIVVFESNTEKAKKIIPVILLASLILIGVTLLSKKI